MVENEALREALLEIDGLRQREAAALKESNALLAGLERMNAAPSPVEAVAALLDSVRESMGCDSAFVMKPVGADLDLVQSAGGPAVRRIEGAAPTILDKPRRLADVTRVGWWRPAPGPEGAADVRSWLSVPLDLAPERLVIACTCASPSFFDAASQRLLTRLSGLASQAIGIHALAERNALLAAVIERSAAAVAIADATRADQPLIYVNKAFEEMTGFCAGEVLGLNCRFLSAEPREAPERKRLRETIAEGGYGKFLLRNRRKNGDVFWNDLSLYPVGNDDGHTRYLVATQVDATERRMMERERDVARDRLATALSEIGEGFLLLDEHDRVVFANERYRTLLPSPATAWRAGTSFVDGFASYLEGTGLAAAQAARAARARLADMRHGPREFEEPLADGRIVSINERATEDGGCLSVVTDVTEIRAQERLLAVRVAAIDSAQDGIAMTDGEGRFFYMNPAHRALFGIAPDADVRGLSWTCLYAPEKVDWLEEHAFPALAANGSWRGEIVGRKLDGSPVEQEVALTQLEGVGIICVTRDISERRRGESERARLIGQLSAAQRQEAIGVIAAGIVHDLNNIISAVTGSATLIAESADIGPAERRHAERIQKAGRSMGGLMQRLLDFAKRTPERADVDLGQVVREAVDLVRISVDRNITLLAEPPDGPVVVPGDPTNLLQIVLNLAINARDAIGGEDGTITLSARRADPASAGGSEDGEVVIGTVEEGWTYGSIAVSDTGSGIDPADFRRIVEPYFSTKGDAGTGLGLAVVAGIVQSMGGYLTIRSQIGAGTTFGVHVPTREVDFGTRPAGRGDGATLETVDLTGRLILLVDDDAVEHDVIEAILTRAGAEVASCHHPHDAVSTVEDDPAAWDVVVTDFDMPEMDGAELAAKVRQVNPDLPVVLFTARDDWRTLARPGAHALFAGEIIKPAPPSDLVRAVAALMPRARAGVENA